MPRRFFLVPVPFTALAADCTIEVVRARDFAEPCGRAMRISRDLFRLGPPLGRTRRCLLCAGSVLAVVGGSAHAPDHNSFAKCPCHSELMALNRRSTLSALESSSR